MNLEQENFMESNTTAPRYLLVQYVPDPWRQEPRNIGVVLWTLEGMAARFFAERGGDALGQVEPDKIPSFVESQSGYRQWISIWRGLLSKRAITPIRGGQPVHIQSTDFLKAFQEFSNDKYQVIEGGLIFDEVEDDLEDAATYLFDTLVADPESGNIDDSPSKERVDWVCSRLLKETGLKSSQYFHQHRALGDDDAVFDYVIEAPNQPIKVYQTLPLPGQQSVIERYTNDLLFRFNLARQKRYAAGHNGTALIYAPDQALKRPYIEQSIRNIRKRNIRVINLAREQEFLTNEWRQFAALSSGAKNKKRGVGTQLVLV